MRTRAASTPSHGTPRIRNVLRAQATMGESGCGDPGKGPSSLRSIFAHDYMCSQMRHIYASVVTDVPSCIR